MSKDVGPYFFMTKKEGVFMTETYDERKYCVYMHTSLSGKVYIGITSTRPEKRWGNTGAGYQSQQYMWRAIQKYGWGNFKHEILYKNLTEETKQKLSESNSGQGNPFYGRKHSEEARRKISESNSGSKNGRARQVVQYDEFGNLICICGNIREASATLNINYTSIGACCRDRQRKAGGFMWKYLSEEEVDDVESFSV